MWICTYCGSEVNPADSRACCGERHFEEIEFAVAKDDRVRTLWFDTYEEAEAAQRALQRFRGKFEIIERVKEY